MKQWMPQLRVFDHRGRDRSQVAVMGIVYAMAAAGTAACSAVFLSVGDGDIRTVIGLLNVPATGLAVFAAIGCWRELRRVPTLRPGICFNCGYDLTGNISGVCPECGTAEGQFFPQHSDTTSV